jgi:hypothetical protein
VTLIMLVVIVGSITIGWWAKIVRDLWRMTDIRDINPPAYRDQVLDLEDLVDSFIVEQRKAMGGHVARINRLEEWAAHRPPLDLSKECAPF